MSCFWLFPIVQDVEVRFSAQRVGFWHVPIEGLSAIQRIIQLCNERWWRIDVANRCADVIVLLMKQQGAIMLACFHHDCRAGGCRCRQDSSLM